MKIFMRLTAFLFSHYLASILFADGEKPLNLLLITVDDMSCDSVGAFGCEMQGTTPVMDRLASQSMRFDYAHVTVGNCNPCRNVMFSGLISHNNGVEGFYKVPNPGWPHMVDLLRSAGYYTAIRGKVTHSSPYQPYAWDDDLTIAANGSKAHVKDAESYGESTARGIAKAKQLGKPFFLSVNISDPHRPFWSQVRKGGKDPYVPSRIFHADEVPVPGFLFEDFEVRKELALYYSSVRRADDCLDQVLKAVRMSGEWEDTMIVFLSDHGMPLPFAKTQLYHHSTHTPLMVRIPGVTKPGTLDQQHMVSVLDLLPTVLHALGVDQPSRLDGRSFYPVLKGQTQKNRDFVIKQYHENSGGSRDPMRAIQSKRFLYIFNPWSNGERVFATATNGTQTCKRMIELSKTNEEIKSRYDLYRFRVPEELYDVKADPDCLYNLIDDPKYAAHLQNLQKKLEEWMMKSGDPILEALKKRTDSEFVEAYVQELEMQSDARRKKDNTFK